jgi:pheromone a factor receptor
MFWSGLGCLNFFINSVMFSHTAQNIAPRWCEVSTRIIIAQAIGIPAASLCINRRLYGIASLKSTSLSISEKRRGVMIDLAIGLGLPLLELPLGICHIFLRFFSL